MSAHLSAVPGMPPLSPERDGGYEPRYAVGDRYRDGLGGVWEITEIHRASSDDGHSSAWAVRDGFTSYRARRVGGRESCTLAASYLHGLIDSSWVYLGRAAAAVQLELGSAS